MALPRASELARARLGIIAASAVAVATGGTSGAVLGLLGGIAAAFVLEFVNDTIETRDDVKSMLGVPCLGIIPCHQGKSPLTQELEDAKSAVSDAYSEVIAALRFSGAGSFKALLVTSASPAEGKSSSVLAMSQNYARRGERVLLIDADLRRPAFASTSNLEGLTTLLSTAESIRSHVVDTQHENLWLLPCGPIASNAADLFASPRFGAILTEAKARFDRVIVDGPPMLGLADASFLAEFVGQVMIVAESGRTRARCAHEVIERITSSGAQIVGITITKSVARASRKGYKIRRHRPVLSSGSLDFVSLARG